jgi:methylisocitrate lyase
MTTTPGHRFRKALATELPLQIPGVLNPYAALMAQEAGFKALYLSGAGISNISYGLPDLGMTTLDNVLEDLRRILDAVDLPLLVDIDTGWGNAFMIARAIKEIEKAGAAAVHIEDQVFTKRCGHRMGKQLVPAEEMTERIKSAVEAKKDKDFIIMARVDAYANEGLERTIERAVAYRDAGADMIFPEAMETLEHYRQLREAVGIPILANLTEFGRTPLYTREELADAGVDMALYPLSASRAMQKAAMEVYKEIRSKGTQKGLIHTMQTREELYRFLNYDEYERKADNLIL